MGTAEFAVELAFALTYYKLQGNIYSCVACIHCYVFYVVYVFYICYVQGKTIVRLIADLNDAGVAYEFVYVAKSRVEYGDHFRISPLMKTRSHQKTKQVNKYTEYFLACYDEHGNGMKNVRLRFTTSILQKRENRKKSKNSVTK